MSGRIFTLLLSISLTLQYVCTGFQVRTLFQYNVNDNSSVNIICQHNGSEEWTMRAIVSINGQDVCRDDQSNTACNGTKDGNQFNFTLKFPAEHERFLYRCKLCRHAPLPILIREGEEISLLPGCVIPPRATSNDCSHVELLTLLFWALLGIVVLLGLYSMIITAVYILLRRKFSEELSVTYVSMQQKKVRPKKRVKGNGTDKNEEYMDMREVHHHAQPIRDMNHNSRLGPVGFSV